MRNHLEIAYVFNFSYRKFKILKTFLPTKKLIRINKLTDVPPQAFVYVWGMQQLDACAAQLKIIRVEDGFIRSIGLGAALTPPISWVFDSSGLYFNTTQPSDLENILNNHYFDNALINRAKNLQILLILNRLSKYNLVSAQQITTTNIKASQKKILVIGQVEGDASLHYGSPAINTNIALLKSVYAQRKQEFIVYRPHPDVFNGWRHDSLSQQEALGYCSMITTTGHVLDWIDWADEIHVMTSLTGFEALIRNKTVYCYGLPFYAGWGLTVDLECPKRRQRSLNVYELVAGSMIVYPQYRSIKTHKKLEVEQAIDELVALKQNHLQQKKPSWWINLLKPWLKRH